MHAAIIPTFAQHLRDVTLFLQRMPRGFKIAAKNKAAAIAGVSTAAPVIWLCGSARWSISFIRSSHKQ
jgi:hypothetical protein